MYPTAASYFGLSALLQSDLAGTDRSLLITKALTEGSSPAPNNMTTAFSQVVRCGPGVQCEVASGPLATILYVGYSVRTTQWRYTAWFPGSSGPAVNWNTEPYAQELYSHANDAALIMNFNHSSYDVDNYNLAPNRTDVCQALLAKLKSRFNTA